LATKREDRLESARAPQAQIERAAVLLDPFPLWLEAVEAVLRRIDVVVVGKTTSSAEALALVEEHDSDLLITEIKTRGPEMDGINCLRQARDRVPHLKGIVLSVYDDPSHIEAAFEAGASAYVLKTAQAEDFATTVRQAFEQSIYFDGVRGDSATVPPRPAKEERARLTRRELEILKLAAEGYKNVEMAGMLWLTEQTIKFHLSNIYRKLNVSNRTEASRWAQVNGLLPRSSARELSS